MRFGPNKLLHTLPDGTPVGIVAAKNLLAALPKVTAIVRSGDLNLAPLFHDLGLRVLECDYAHAGMGHSLSYAVRAHPHASGWIIALADMPYIRPDTIRTLASALGKGASLTAPFYQGKRGHPVGFSHEHYVELTGLQGDKGAQDLLHRYRDRLYKLDCDDVGILRDIDLPSDITPA